MLARHPVGLPGIGPKIRGGRGTHRRAPGPQRPRWQYPDPTRSIATVPRTDTASRVIPAPVPVVYAALVDPEALSVWIPPGDMTASIERFDLRPGGSYRMVLTHAEDTPSRGKTTADTDVVDARFIEIVPDVRVVYSVTFVSDDPAYAGTMTMTWAVEATDGGTLVELTADDVPDGISARDHADGMHSSLRNLAEYVAQ